MATTLTHQKIKNINKLNYNDVGKILNIMLGKIKNDHDEVLIIREQDTTGLHEEEAGS